MSDQTQQRPGNGRAAADQPIGELVKQLSEQTSTLVRQELALARAEVTQKGKTLGVGAGMFGGAGFFGVFAFAAVTAGLILALATAVDAWLAAVIVAAVYGAIAGVLALIGKSRVRAAGPPVPEAATASVKRDVQTAKQALKDGRS
jgi:hypothetical protein